MLTVFRIAIVTQQHIIANRCPAEMRIVLRNTVHAPSLARHVSLHRLVTNAHTKVSHVTTDSSVHMCTVQHTLAHFLFAVHVPCQ